MSDELLRRIAMRLNDKCWELDKTGEMTAQIVAVALGFVKDAILQELAETRHPGGD